MNFPKHSPITVQVLMHWRFKAFLPKICKTWQCGFFVCKKIVCRLLSSGKVVYLIICKYFVIASRCNNVLLAACLVCPIEYKAESNWIQSLKSRHSGVYSSSCCFSLICMYKYRIYWINVLSPKITYTNIRKLTSYTLCHAGTVRKTTRGGSCKQTWVTDMQTEKICASYRHRRRNCTWKQKPWSSLSVVEIYVSLTRCLLHYIYNQ